jgi:YD repeat-containing protein
MKIRFLVGALLILTGICLHAQLSYPIGTKLFDGIHNFKSDSVLRAMVNQQHVKSISQVVSNRNYTFSYGEFSYNEKAQVTRMRTQSANIGYEYIDNLCTKELHYAKQDSLESWTDYVYDDKSRLLKTVRNYHSQGKFMSYTEIVSKLISEDHIKKHWETTEYSYQDIYTITQSLDSTANNSHYYIEYKYRPKEVDEKGRKRGNKKLTKTYTKDNCKYEIVVKYKVYGRLESPDDVKTYYYQGDKNGHLLEFGEIDYESAMHEYMSRHPEEFVYGVLPPNFIKEILNGELNTNRTPKIKQVYDAKGRIIERTHYNTRYTFSYNAKGQLVEQIKQGTHPTKDQLFYNEKGLITRLLTTGYTADSGNKTVVLEESNFTYTYY